MSFCKTKLGCTRNRTGARIQSNKQFIWSYLVNAPQNTQKEQAHDEKHREEWIERQQKSSEQWKYHKRIYTEVYKIEQFRK